VDEIMFHIWALFLPLLSSSVAPHQVLGAPAHSVQLNKVFSRFLLLTPPSGRNVPSQWLDLQFGMTSLCCSAGTLSQAFLSTLQMVLFGCAGIGSAS